MAAPNGARDAILRTLKNCGDGFATNRLLQAASGVPNDGTLATHVHWLRQAGHSIERVKALSGSGFRLLPPEQMGAE